MAEVPGKLIKEILNSKYRKCVITFGIDYKTCQFIPFYWTGRGYIKTKSLLQLWNHAHSCKEFLDWLFLNNFAVDGRWIPEINSGNTDKFIEKVNKELEEFWFKRR